MEMMAVRIMTVLPFVLARVPLVLSGLAVQATVKLGGTRTVPVIRVTKTRIFLQCQGTEEKAAQSGRFEFGGSIETSGLPPGQGQAKDGQALGRLLAVGASVA